MRIATTTGDFKDYVARDNVAGAVRLLAACGFKHIDVSLDSVFYDGSPMRSDNWREWAEGIRKAGEEVGVDFVQAHATDGCFDEGPDREYRISMLKREMQICKMLGIPGMVVHGICRPNGTREEFMTANAKFYGELLPEAEATGVKIYTENTCRQNCPTYFLFEGADFNELRARLDNHPMFGCCWDVGHGNCHGVDQYKSIMEMGDGLMAVHIHDNVHGFDAHVQPFCGNTNYDAIINGLVDGGFKGCFTLESYSLPVPRSFCNCNRQRFLQKGPEFDRLSMLPIEFKMRSEILMLDIVRYMLQTYNCYDD
ncbi:MAG: sugar phosphate isomerase/epimerase [Victivallales bacterium]|nr:sugar phosphate isomerase/epimerase [Victivallales bacterium]